MSQENVEVVRRFYPASGDMEAVVDQVEHLFAEGLIDPEVEWSPAIIGSAEGHGYRGHDGVRRWAHDMTDAWESFHVQATELRDIGERVLVMVQTSARGRASGAVLERPVAHVWTFRDGRVVRMRSYEREEDALEAVGLSE